MTKKHRTTGFTLIEVTLAVSLLAIGVLAIFMMNTASMSQMNQMRERTIARFAAESVRACLQANPFRWNTHGGTDTGGPTPLSVLDGGFPISWDSTGSTFAMPSIKTTALSGITATGATNNSTPGATAYGATVDGIAGCVCVEFPVQWLRLKGVGNRLNPGRLVFYLAESSFPTTANANFPFPTTPGLNYLDCDGCGLSASATADLRAGNQLGTAAANPCYLIPVRVSIDWLSATYATSPGNAASLPIESYSVYFMLSYQGYDHP